MRLTATRSFAIAIVVMAFTSAVSAADAPPGAIRLLPGYTHKTLQGFDSKPGEISKKGGLQIRYDIGRVAKPGTIGLGGDFSDQAKRVPPKSRRWYKEQTIGGQPVHLAYTKDDVLSVSYPASGINFSVKAKTHEELTDALLIILSFPAAAKAK